MHKTTETVLRMARFNGLPLLLDAKLQVSVVAENKEAGMGAPSTVVAVATLPILTQPSAPSAAVIATTAGTATLQLSPPEDLGGASSVSYLLYLRRQDAQVLHPLKHTASRVYTISNLRAFTSYVLAVQAQHVGGSTCPAGLRVTLATGSATAEMMFGSSSGDMTPTELHHHITASLHDVTLCVRPSGVDSSTVATVSLARVTPTDIAAGELPLTRAYKGTAVDEGIVCFCGEPSNPVSFATKEASTAGPCDPPVVLAATGGLLSLAMTSGADTGGTAVTHFQLLLSPEDPTSMHDFLKARGVAATPQCQCVVF